MFPLYLWLLAQIYRCLNARAEHEIDANYCGRPLLRRVAENKTVLGIAPQKPQRDNPTAGNPPCPPQVNVEAVAKGTI